MKMSDCAFLREASSARRAAYQRALIVDTKPCRSGAKGNTSRKMRMRHRWLFITVTCVLQIHACYAAAIISRSLSSYQPTPGVEERWVAEEEFYKASDIATAEPNVDNSDSWWDDDDEESDVEVGQSSIDHLHDDYSTTPSTKDRSHEKQHRWRRRKRSEDKGNVEESSPTSKQSTGDATNKDDLIQTTQYDDEHELRTDEWELDIRLSRLFAQEAQELFPESCADGRERDGKSSSTYRKLRSNDRYRKRQVMTFARNGYVRIDNTTPPQNNNRPRVGKWRIGHSGVAFDIPVLISANRKKSSGSNSDKVMSPKKMTVLHYHADIHLNKFGERPRMFRGVITRDRYVLYSLFQRSSFHFSYTMYQSKCCFHTHTLSSNRHSSFLPPNLFRPVIGTFSAEGIGHDTADTSYKARAISLSRQQVINDAKTNSNKK